MFDLFYRLKFKIFILLCFIFLFFVSHKTFAATLSEAPFGGRLIAAFSSDDTCTCRGNSYWIFDYVSKSLIKLYKSPSSIFFLYYNTNATYQLGSRTSYASDSCWVYVEEECVEFSKNDYDYGSRPGTGTSLK